MPRRRNSPAQAVRARRRSGAGRPQSYDHAVAIAINMRRYYYIKTSKSLKLEDGANLASRLLGAPKPLVPSTLKKRVMKVNVLKTWTAVASPDDILMDVAVANLDPMVTNIMDQFIEEEIKFDNTVVAEQQMEATPVAPVPAPSPASPVQPQAPPRRVTLIRLINLEAPPAPTPVASESTMGDNVTAAVIKKEEEAVELMYRRQTRSAIKKEGPSIDRQTTGGTTTPFTSTILRTLGVKSLEEAKQLGFLDTPMYDSESDEEED